jgi:hypothetical protein
MRVAVPGADRDVSGFERYGDHATTAELTTRQVLVCRAARPFGGARAAPRGRHRTKPICHSKEWLLVGKYGQSRPKNLQALQHYVIEVTP